ncbi:hypothetical protein [Paenibacillus spongiae]|uniref:IstB-like ATP-binding protein domain-containing protein n=1 Tax=Paenibacillus spongiae TaxID=2909671 RepID=A0ABY5S7Z8_9BACL|nr:hypothetical protein [Paenibacillus spongiae]UVI30032.1 hypothetical protein L1F29_32410 [Paenibacillus spongiae]
MLDPENILTVIERLHHRASIIDSTYMGEAVRTLVWTALFLLKRSSHTIP